MTDKILNRLNKFDTLIEVYERASGRASEEYPVEIGNCGEAVDYWRDCGLQAVIKYIKTGRKK